MRRRNKGHAPSHSVTNENEHLVEEMKRNGAGNDTEHNLSSLCDLVIFTQIKYFIVHHNASLPSRALEKCWQGFLKFPLNSSAFIISVEYNSNKFLHFIFIEV